MKYKLHDNGWTVIVHDFDVKNATQEEADEIARLISSNIVVYINDSRLIDVTPEDQVRFCEMIGNIRTLDKTDIRSVSSAISEDEVGRKIQRVTAEKNEHGFPGLFGHKEDLDWHNNRPWDLKRKPLVWLKSVKGAEGSRTSWTNTIEAYKDMKEEFPDFIAELEEKQYRVVCGWKDRSQGGHTTMYTEWAGMEQFKPLIGKNRSEETAMPLIFTNEGGNKGFFLPYLQSFNLAGLTDEESEPIMRKVWEYTMREKYLYHHDWAAGGGEVVIAEQWNSVHKRWEFDGMEGRVLHRLSMDYSNTTWWPEHSTRFKAQQHRALKENLRFLANIKKSLDKTDK